MSDIPQIVAHIRVDAAGRIDQDVPCLECRYNLRGLDPAGRCPECGHGNAQSLRGDYLHFSDRAWLKRLRLGAALVVVGGPIWLLRVLHDDPPRAGEFIRYLPPLLVALGSWLATAPEPRGRREGFSCARARCRGLGLALILFAEVRAVMPAHGGIAGDLASLLTLSLLGGWIWSAGDYLMGIARRVPDRVMRLEAFAVSRAWVGVLVAALVCVFGAPIYLTPAQPWSSGSMSIGGMHWYKINAIYEGVLSVLDGTALVLSLWSLRVLIVLWRRLQRALAAGVPAPMNPER
jgi:hypothetical protein